MALEDRARRGIGKDRGALETLVRALQGGFYVSRLDASNRVSTQSAEGLPMI
jgi:hypothetical protein